MIRAWRLSPSRDASATSDPANGAPDASPVAGRSLLEDTLADPTLEDDSVLVRVQACVFGAPERMSSTDVVPGGAAVGTVVRAGSEAAHLLHRRVVVGPEQACGECDVCRRGTPVLCPKGHHLGRDVHGALATEVKARARWLCALGDELSGAALDSPAAALIGREAAWAYTMFARAGVAPGEPVFVVGHDVVARLLVEVAIAKGVRPMAVFPAEQTGFADWIATTSAVPVAVADPGELAAAALAAATAGGHGRRPWFVFETSGTGAGRALALALAVPGTRWILLARRALGLDASEASPSGSTSARTIDIDVVTAMDGTVVGVTGAHPDLFPEVAALVVRGELDIAGAACVVAIDDGRFVQDTADVAAPPAAWVVTVSSDERDPLTSDETAAES